MTKALINKGLFLAIFLLGFAGFTLRVAQAQETVRTFTISPPSIQVSLDPGKRTEGKLKIINDGPVPLVFNTSTQDFIVKDNDGTPFILPPNTLSNKYSGASWVAIYPSIITVEPHQRAEVSYFIQVPADARPGGHYAAVVYQPNNKLGVPGTGAAVNTSVGTLFYITVNGPVSYAAKIEKFISKGFFEFGPANVTTQIANNSDVHIKPEGKITLYNMLGGKSDVRELPAYNIFPGVSRNYDTKLGKGFMLGRYKASLQASYAPNTAPLVASLTFWVFPIRLVAFLILMALAIGLGYWYWKKDKRSKDKDSGEPKEEVTEVKPSEPTA